MFTVAVPGIKPTCVAKEDCHATGLDIVLTYVALYLVAIGIGGGSNHVSHPMVQISLMMRMRLRRSKRVLSSTGSVYQSGGSPLTRNCQVIVASWRKHRVHVPDDQSLLYETTDGKSTITGSRKFDHTEGFSFLDKAALELQSDHVKGSTNPWRLCTVTQVEELKSSIKLLPIWATGIIFSAVSSQMSNMLVNNTTFNASRLWIFIPSLKC